jgi:hypothetical protein
MLALRPLSGGTEMDLIHTKEKKPHIFPLVVPWESGKGTTAID